MTEADIIKELAKSLDDRKYPFQVPNAFIYNWECDYWILDALGNTKEFEIKTTRPIISMMLKKKSINNVMAPIIFIMLHQMA